MKNGNPVAISSAVEGLVDEALIKRLVQHLGGSSGPVYGRRGKQYLLDKLKGYNQSARFRPWIVLVDLNHDDDCAPPFRTSLLPNPSPNMCFRIAVREVEAWLFADRERLSRFLSIGINFIPQHPESVDHPKCAMVDLARRSRRMDIRQDMVPRPGSSRKIGPAYTSRLSEFIQDATNGWRPDVAASSSDSLARCLRCLQQLMATGVNREVA